MSPYSPEYLHPIVLLQNVLNYHRIFRIITERLDRIIITECHDMSIDVKENKGK